MSNACHEIVSAEIRLGLIRDTCNTIVVPVSLHVLDRWTNPFSVPNAGDDTRLPAAELSVPVVPGLRQHVRLLSPSGPEIQRGRHPENQPLRADQILRGVGTGKRREAQEDFFLKKPWWLKTRGRHCFNTVI